MTETTRAWRPTEKFSEPPTYDDYYRVSERARICGLRTRTPGNTTVEKYLWHREAATEHKTSERLARRVGSPSMVQHHHAERAWHLTKARHELKVHRTRTSLKTYPTFDRNGKAIRVTIPED